MRLAIFDVVTSDDGGKAVADAGAFEDRLHFGPAGGGDDGKPVSGEVPEQCACGLGNGGIGTGLFPEKGFLFGVILPEIFDVMGGIFLIGEDFEHGAVSDTDTLSAIGFPGQVNSERGEDGGPAIEMDAFAVGENAVEIEENGIERHDGEVPG